MSLGWMFYLADIALGFSILCGLICFVLILYCCNIINNWDTANGNRIKRLIVTLVCLCISALTLIIIPSQTTIYAFGAQYAIEDIATMPETKQLRETLNKFLEVVDSKLDEELEKNDR